MIENCKVDDCQKRLLIAEIGQLRAALKQALNMVLQFSSGCGMSHAGQAEFDRLNDIANEQLTDYNDEMAREHGPDLIRER